MSSRRKLVRALIIRTMAACRMSLGLTRVDHITKKDDILQACRARQTCELPNTLPPVAAPNPPKGLACVALEAQHAALDVLVDIVSSTLTPNELVAPNASDDAPNAGVVDPNAGCVCILSTGLSSCAYA